MFGSWLYVYMYVWIYDEWQQISIVLLYLLRTKSTTYNSCDLFNSFLSLNFLGADLLAPKSSHPCKNQHVLGLVISVL